ncbi:uncharacterized protein C1orf87 homolog [Anomaloglossus baeobatrachus]
MPHDRNPQPVRERMPETIVKIIGSKYVRFPVEKSKMWEQIVDLLQETEKEKKSPEQNVTEKQEEAPRSAEEEGSGQTPHRDRTETQTSDASSAAKSRDHRPQSEPALHLCEPSSSDEQEAWIDRFTRLENVLKLCQKQDTGLVDAVHAAQIITKYNAIHGLCLSPEKIAAALHTFRRGVYILLEPALRFLKEL